MLIVNIMNNTKKSDSLQLVNVENDITLMYNKVMQGFEGISDVMSSDQMIDGYYQMLYAPGYDVIGVGGIVAQCK